MARSWRQRNPFDIHEPEPDETDDIIRKTTELQKELRSDYAQVNHDFVETVTQSQKTMEKATEVMLKLVD